MPLLLTARMADADVRRLSLRFGQEARVGSSEWVELSLAEDESLAEEHFVVRCQSVAIIEALGDQHQLEIDGDTCDRLTLGQDEERTTKFTAGSTHFSVHWSPGFASAALPEETTLPSEPLPADDDSARISVVGSTMSLSDNAVAIQRQPDSGPLYLQRLVECELFDDAIRFIAGFLEPLDAVRWAIGTASLDGEGPSTLVSAIDAWTESCTESARSHVEKTLAIAQPSDVAKWIAQAIVYTGGSLAPSDQPVIRPQSHLSAIAILTAHRWSVARQSDRSQAIQHWIESGKQALTRSEEGTT